MSGMLLKAQGLSGLSSVPQTHHMGGGGGGGDPMGQWSAEYTRKSEELKMYDKDEVHSLVRKAKAEGEKQSLADASDTMLRILRGLKDCYATSSHSSTLVPIFDKGIVLFRTELLRSLHTEQKADNARTKKRKVESSAVAATGDDKEDGENKRPRTEGKEEKKKKSGRGKSRSAKIALSLSGSYESGRLTFRVQDIGSDPRRFRDPRHWSFTKHASRVRSR